jgi:hypothetical protein
MSTARWAPAFDGALPAHPDAWNRNGTSDRSMNPRMVTIREGTSRASEPAARDEAPA